MIFRRPRLKKPGPLPHPYDSLRAEFYNGLAIGVISAIGFGVLLFKG